jgi:tetratricopeptide (TPR) repeat protein
LALEQKNYRALWGTHYFEGIAKTFNCEFAEGEASFLRLMEMAEASGDLTMRANVKLNISGYVYAFWGRIDQALKCSQEALRLAFQADDTHHKSMAYNVCGLALCKKGLFLEAEENWRLMFEMTRKTDNAINLITGFLWLGQICFETGRYQEAQEYCDSFLALYERVRVGPSWARIAQLMKVAAGIKGSLNPAIDTVLNFDLKEIKMRQYQGMAAHFMGEIYLYIDDKHVDEAEAWIRKAIEVDEQNRLPWDLARDYALYAQFFKKKGDPAQAKEKLGKAIELMRGCGADGWVKRYEEALAGIG